MDINLDSFWQVPRSTIVGSYCKNIFDFVRNRPAVSKEAVSVCIE